MSDDDVQELPKLNIKCEVRGNGIIGTTTLNVIRVEAEDDGSFTAVTDYWPERSQVTPDFLNTLKETPDAENQR